MPEENQARTPAAADAPQAPQASSGPGPARVPRARRPARRRSRRPRQVLPPQEGVQVLHREDRCDSLPRRAAAAGVCGRARQDRAAAAHRRLHHAPAPPDPRHQAGPQHRPAAVCHAALRQAQAGCDLVRAEHPERARAVQRSCPHEMRARTALAHATRDLESFPWK